MPDGQVLEFTRVTKRFNDVTAVSDLSARVEPGVVTAFLGPNGAGKTTSLRILLGQVRATGGTATIGGVAYPELRHPLRTIGSVLEETVYRPRRSASRHLTIAAKANGIPLSRVDEVLSLVGLENEAEGRVGSFSLGMRQRLSVAHALLGDPGALVFDEPANGLDPEGIRWMRLLMRRLADEGRTVLVSSHVLSEVEQVADHVLVLSKGQLVLSSGIETLADPSGGSVIVDSADRVALRGALSSAGFEVEVLRSGLRVRGGDAQTVGAIAASAGVALSTLVQRGPTLEDVFIELVRGGTLGPRAVAVASEYVAPQEPVPAPEAEAEADATADVPLAGTGAAVDDSYAVQTADPETAPETDAEQAAETATEQVVEADADRDGVAEQNPEAVDGTIAEGQAASFDDILFGTANGDENAVEEQSAQDENASGDPVTNAAGVEVFDGLGDQDAPAERDDASAEDAEEDDARSAAVSSMLAAAARAYYDDEPAEYPLGDSEAQTPGPDGEESSDRTSDDSAHWSVASTGVIDQVPAPAPTDDSASAEDEHRHDGEHHHDGEHRDEAEQHQGEHDEHQGEHEQHQDGEHHHDGEHRQD